MLLLFLGGVMNVVWIAGIAIFVLIEKIVPNTRIISRISGCVAGLAGIWLVFQSLS